MVFLVNFVQNMESDYEALEEVEQMEGGRLTREDVLDKEEERAGLLGTHALQ